MGILFHTTAGRYASGEPGPGERDGPGPGERDGLRLIDVGPTIVDTFGLAVGEDAAGRPIDL